MPVKPFDIAIVGAGVVGCAMARRFTLEGANVVVIEKAPDVLDGASKGNSAILHTGFDAPPGSLEQQCISHGYSEYLTVSQQLGLPILKSCALVLAWNHDQANQLPDLIAKAHQNKVLDVNLLTKDAILEREPHLSKAVVSGFEIPGEFLIDPWTSAHAYLLQAMANGATLLRSTEVLSGQFKHGGWSLQTSNTDIHARYVINCAGLYGDVVSERLTGATAFSITPRKGQFVVFDKPASRLATSILLPVPTKNTKGVVVCRTIYGNLLVGPTAEDQSSRDNASTDSEALNRLIDQGTQVIPELSDYEITATYAGLRPATEFQDYQLHNLPEQNFITVGGIRSTGLSAALGIAQHVSKLLSADAFSSKPLSKPTLPSIDKLSDYHPRDWQAPDHGDIVCQCELVTRREIANVMNGAMPPASLQGLKRRTRVCMGRCQGFYCTAEVAKMTASYFDVPLATPHG